MAVFARGARDAGVDTSTLLLLRFSMAGLALGAMLLARRGRLPRGRDLAILVTMGAVGYAGQAFCFFSALELGSAGLAALLLYLYPALVALLARAIFGHPLSRLQLAALAMALAGSALTIGRAGDAPLAAVAFGILAALIYAVYILAGSRLSPGVGATASSAAVVTSAAAVYACVGIARGLHLPRTFEGWACIAAIAVVCTVLAIGFFLAGLERIGPVRASVYSTVEPAFTLLLAALLLEEPVTLFRLLGGGLIVGAVLLLARADLAAEGAPTGSQPPAQASPGI
jgi:drug/metabolite transporter (DMT)-like permease